MIWARSRCGLMTPPSPRCDGAAIAIPTAKQHLASLRMLFAWLITGQVFDANPTAPKHVVKKGTTPVLKTDEARTLLDSIQVGSPPTAAHVGLCEWLRLMSSTLRLAPRKTMP